MYETRSKIQTRLLKIELGKLHTALAVKTKGIHDVSGLEKRKKTTNEQKGLTKKQDVMSVTYIGFASEG